MGIGILAVQGGYEAHGKILKKLGASFSYIYHPQQLMNIRGLILPGGESTAILKFLSQNNFQQEIINFAKAGGSLFGTCAGAILLAQEVFSPPQSSLQLLDISIERNAYGRQLSSQIVKGSLLKDDKPLEMVFIRAPRITRIGENVNVFATYGTEPVGLLQQNVMLTTFHPELTEDTRIHQLFLGTII